MVSEQKFDLTQYPLRGAVDSLNAELTALDLRTPEQTPEQQATYGEGVFGIRFNGNTRFGALVDNIARSMWPEDLAAVLPQSSGQRDHLVVAANHPDGVTESLQFFTTFRPGMAPWIADETEGSPLRELAKAAVNIDSSAKLQTKDRMPPQYNGTVNAYLMNLYWLVVEMDYPSAVLEINRKMHASLGMWGVELGNIEGAEPRTIGGTDYSRCVIDPSTNTNTAIVSVVRSTPPAIFTIDDRGLAVLDEPKPVAA